MRSHPGQAWREFRLITGFRRRWSRLGPGDRLGMGDDAAAYRPEPGQLELVTCDALGEGVHWDFAWCSPRDVGRKAAAVNCSDIAAMGGSPRRAYLCLALPPRTPERDVNAFMAGLVAELTRHGARLAGGDTVASNSGWWVGVTLQGVVPAKELLSRAGARPGDALLVTGRLGGAAAGLDLARRPAKRIAARRSLLTRLLAPRPRLAEGRVLARSGKVHALLDLSDGLAGDLRRLCEASRVGVRVHAEKLPLAAGLHPAAKALGKDALAWALRGGEDYELLIAAPAAAAEKLSRDVRRQTGTLCTMIGEILPAHRGLRLVGPDGRESAWPAGWEHQG